MNILFYLHEFCYPLRGGDRVRIFNFLRKLNQSHSLYLISLTQFGVEKESFEKIKPYFKDIIIIENKKKMALWRYVKSLITGIPYKVIHYNSIKAEQAIHSMIQTYNIDILVLDYFFIASKNIKKIKIKKYLLAPNLEYVLLKRFMKYGSLKRKIYGFTQWKSLMKYEINSYNYFDKIIFVSEHDEKQAKIKNPDIDSEVVEGGIDTHYFLTKREQKPSIPHLIFVGTLWYYPNIQAINYFVRKILPFIKKEISEIQLTIVGDNPSKEIKNLAKKSGISLFGSVADVRNFIDRASAFIVPHKIVSGVPYKILEALSMKIPVISTVEACEGLKVNPGENILVAETPEEFARCVIKVIKDEFLWEKISTNGRKFVETCHNADITAEKLEMIINSLDNRVKV